MNILPTGPQIDGDPNFEQYFADLERWNFDIAYNAFYAFPMGDVLGTYQAQYRKFTRMARERGIPSCVQIQSVVAHLDDIPLSESQYYADNTCHVYEHFPGSGRKYHFASFASEIWLRFLKDLSTLFRDFDFDWVVFEEPMMRVDVPGTMDRFHERFRALYPGMVYPTRFSETVEYLTVQKAKRDILVEFYDQLSGHAKRAGFKKIGIMPWFFAPTFENTPAETWNSCCDIGRLTFLQNMDFVVVRMQPDNIYAQVMESSNGECVPELAHYECLAHQSGKPIIMVNNPSDEHSPEANREDSLIPLAFFTRYTLAATAAAPCGMSRHWYNQNRQADHAHMELMTHTNDMLRRLGTPAAEVAFVFSYSGISHAYPRAWRDVWKGYWNFAQQILEGGNFSFLTFYAESLAHHLQQNPQVRVVVLYEFMPIPPEEVAVLERWVREGGERRILCIGGRNGYRWDHAHGFETYRLRPPEMFSLCGVDVEEPVRIASLESTTKVEFVSNFVSDRVFSVMSFVNSATLCHPRFLPDAEVDVVYRTQCEGLPVVTRRRFGDGGEAWFVGVSLDGPVFTSPMRRIVRTLLGYEQEQRRQLVLESGHGIYHSLTKNGFFVVANTSKDRNQIKFSFPQSLWDAPNTRMIRALKSLWMEPWSVRLFRLLGPETRILDLEGCVQLQQIDEGESEVLIEGMFHREFRLLTNSPVLSVSGPEQLRYVPSRKFRKHFVTDMALPEARDVRVLLQFG
ncbi:MAG: hypothetical protein K1X53_06460 [Candidatus Sumerlaeaceae bacterium]|nr:hypothetical protein [Candidatus Sumerlaeaceae bacterium]